MPQIRISLLLIPLLLVSQWLGFAFAHTHDAFEGTGRRHIHLGSFGAGHHHHSHAAGQHAHEDDHGHADRDHSQEEHAPPASQPAPRGSEDLPLDEMPLDGERHAGVFWDSVPYLASSSVGASIEGRHNQHCVGFFVSQEMPAGANRSAPHLGGHGPPAAGDRCSGFLATPGCPLFLRTLSIRI